MEKVIEIEPGRNIRFKASAYSPIQFGILFPGKDFMKEIQHLGEVREAMKDDEQSPLDSETYQVFARMAYLFAYQALSASPRESEEQKEFREKYPDPWEWIDTFDTFSIYFILPQIVELWKINNRGSAIRKKKRRRRPAN